MTEQATTTVSTYLFNRMAELGANHVFGIPGDYVLPLFDELIDGNHNSKHILVCNELNGAYAADGYAKLSGFGAMAVTFGVGSLSTANAVGGAYADDTPMVVIAGAPSVEVITTPSRRKLHHVMGQDFDAYLKAFAPITVAAHRLMSAETAAQEIDDILRQSYQSKKPIYLEIPYDIQTAQIPVADHALDLMMHQSSDDGLKAAVAATVAVLKESRTRTIVTGHLLQREKLIEPAKVLVEGLNAGVATTFVGKISDFEGHPNAVGLYMGAMSNEATRNAVENADTSIALGMSFNEFDTGVFTGKMGMDQHNIWVDFDQVTVDGTVFDKVYLRDFLPALIGAIHPIEPGELMVGKDDRRFCFQRSDAFEPTDAPLTIDRLYVQFANYAKEGDVFYGDTGGYINGSQAEFPIGMDIYGVGNWGSLGAGFGMFTGGVFAKEAKGRRTYMISGDGAFHMTAQEVSTLIKYDVDTIIFILDNSGYGAERQIYPGKERSYNNTPVWNYEDLGTAFGGVKDVTTKGYVARTEKEMADVLEELREPKGVNIVRIMLDPWDSASFNVTFSEALRH